MKATRKATMGATSGSWLAVLLSVGMLFLLLVTACTVPPSPLSIPPEKQCTKDYDCVPKECCHPKDAVNRQYAADCTGLLCTMECVPGTIDCDQGVVTCVEGECRAVVA